MSNVITTIQESFEFLLNSPSRLKEEAANIFQNKTTFKIRVLSNPVPYSGPATVTDDTELIDDQGTDSKYIFKGRILDSNMAHEKFLQDPCDRSITSTPAADIFASLHCNVILSKAGGRPQISAGDIIFGEADSGENSLYDLQFLQMSSISDVFQSSDAQQKIDNCIKVKESFAGWDGSLLGDNFVMPAYDPLSGDVYIDTASYAPTLSELIVAFLNELQKRISNNQIPQGIVITSGYRSPEAQARTSYDKLVSEGAGTLVDLYAQDDLAQEVEDAYFRDGTLEAIEEVYRAQVARGRYISRHMQSGAVDIGVGGTGPEAVGGVLNATQRQLVIDTANSITGLPKSFFYEPSAGSGNHIHGEIPSSFLEVNSSPEVETPEQHEEEFQ